MLPVVISLLPKLSLALLTLVGVLASCLSLALPPLLLTLRSMRTSTLSILPCLLLGLRPSTLPLRLCKLMILQLLIVILSFLLPPCQSEDDNNCYWDASIRGNQQGDSFIVVNDNVYYL